MQIRKEVFVPILALTLSLVVLGIARAAFVGPSQAPPNGDGALTTSDGNIVVAKSGDVTTTGLGQFLQSGMTTDGREVSIAIGKSLAAGGSGLFGYRYDTTVGDETAYIAIYGDSAALNVRKGGNVGIGTATPSVKLDVAGQTNTQALFVKPTSGTSSITIQDGVPTTTSTITLSSSLFTIANNALPMVLNANTNGGITSQVYLATTGNVGIGTAAPNAMLTVGTALSGTALGTTFTTNAGALGGTATNSLNLANIGFASSNSSSLGIRAYRATTGGAWDTTAIGLGMSVDNTVWDTNTIWIHANGNIGIGTIVPGYKLQVAGTVAASSFYYTSDISLKTDIDPLGSMLGKLVKLSGVSYRWKDTGKLDIGLIAQDVEKIFPEFVSTNETTGLKSVDYAKLTVPLIEVVKEQQNEIDELRKEIEQLKADD